jgi:hypothetical protein
MNIFKIYKEERWVALLTLLFLLCLNWMLISSYPDSFTKGGTLGYWSIFSKNFRVSGYDCWSYIMLSNLRIHFETTRHPLFLSILYPLYLLNHGMMWLFGSNFAIYIMALLLLFCSIYSVLFMYRIFSQVLELRKFDAFMFTAMFLGIAHVLVAMIVPDHFAISLFLLTMTLYIAGLKIKNKSNFKLWQIAVLFFVTSGVTLTNGAKTLLTALFVNGKKYLCLKSIVLTIFLPLVLLLGVYWFQYNVFELPQKQVIHKIEKNNKEKKGEEVARHNAIRNKWISEHTGRPLSDAPLLNLTDATTPRVATVVENLFGESIQLHQNHLLQDLSFTRPMFVKYSHWFNYAAEAIIVLMFVFSLWAGRNVKLLRMCMSWFAVDMILHLVLGFGITEVYIMSADWIFIIPLALATLMQISHDRHKIALRIVCSCITLYLLLWNVSLLFSYLDTPFDKIPKF